MPDFYRLVGVNIHVMMTAKCYKKKIAMLYFPALSAFSKMLTREFYCLKWQLKPS